MSMFAHACTGTKIKDLTGGDSLAPISSWCDNNAKLAAATAVGTQQACQKLKLLLHWTGWELPAVQCCFRRRPLWKKRHSICTEHNDRIIAFIGSPGLLAAWLVLSTLVTFLIFGVDKLLAQTPPVPPAGAGENLLLLGRGGRQRGCPAGDVPLPPQDAPPGLSGGVPVILAVQLLLAAALPCTGIPAVILF